MVSFIIKHTTSGVFYFFSSERENSRSEHLILTLGLERLDRNPAPCRLFSTGEILDHFLLENLHKTVTLCLGSFGFEIRRLGGSFKNLFKTRLLYIISYSKKSFEVPKLKFREGANSQTSKIEDFIEKTGFSEPKHLHKFEV